MNVPSYSKWKDIWIKKLQRRFPNAPKITPLLLLEVTLKLQTHTFFKITVEPRYFEVPREMEKSSK